MNYTILLKKIIEFKICEKTDDNVSLFSELTEVLINTLFASHSNLENEKPTIEDIKERKCLFNLILEISKFHDHFILEIIFLLSKHFEEDPNNHGFYVSYESRKLDEFSGLRNLRNNCYLNSVIQQLYFIDDFREYIIEKSISTQGDCDAVYKQLRYLFANLKSSVLKVVSPIAFTKNFKAFDGEPINPNQQQDANEFYSLLLNEIELQLKDVPNNIAKTYFLGLLVNKIVSLESEMPFESRNEEPFMTILLDIKHNRNMFDSLDQFTRSEIMDEENKYYCDKYNTKIKAIRKYEFNNFPPCLTFTLNRFAFDQKTLTRVKLNDYFEFPFEINMSNWTEQVPQENSVSSLYKLVGVIVHSGMAESGHYFSYIFNNGKWYEFNDTKVVEKDITNVT
jgi:ubiquitin carboxyl-terminal hydrolase 34